MLKIIIKIKKYIKIGIIFLFLIVLQLAVFSIIAIDNKTKESIKGDKEIIIKEEKENSNKEIIISLIEEMKIIESIEKQLEEERKYEVVLSASNDYLPPKPGGK
ncbi:hypothetical protein PT447_00025 [Aliarcobacter butzleri]|uniref:hypothetical protein n=1 Tax=Aliarcobacter butzleri TaxID=28197 RepID=UPI0024DEEFED|nr:hypothetical protein [Aliarcobacter butzleri]MDK2063305.1 hypothetical protein [Aliarcobacter butzleri]